MTGTKHWITGRLKDLVKNKYILTYNNTPNQVFQQNTDYEFPLPTYEDEKNSPDCTATFYNTSASQQFTRNNCDSGYIGSSVTYTVPAGRYSSNISQSAADELAQSDINTNGQNYANSTGTCNLIPTFTATRTANFTRNNCDSGYAGSSVSFTKTYSSTISQADADNKAATDSTFNSQGQANANTNGTCTLIPTYSYTRTSDFQKNDCTGAGYTGSIVSFSKTYTSNISQQDAMNIANADTTYNTQGQQNANTNGTCNAPLPPDAVGILVVDIYNNTTITPVGYVSTPSTTPYNQAVSSGSNFYPNDGTPAAQCWALASDQIAQDTLKWRFEFNIARLINTYPDITTFQFTVKDADINQNVSGVYSLKGADAGFMTMTGSPGNYIPSSSGASSIGVISYTSKNIQSGLIFNYDVASKTITLL